MNLGVTACSVLSDAKYKQDIYLVQQRLDNDIVKNRFLALSLYTFELACS